MRKTGLSLLTPLALLLALAGSAAAQDYPTKPVRLIIPFPPGGSNDVVGRMIATQLGERLGKQVVVDNRGGGAASSAPRLRPARRPTAIPFSSSRSPTPSTPGSTSSSTIPSSPSCRWPCLPRAPTC